MIHTQIENSLNYNSLHIILAIILILIIHLIISIQSFNKKCIHISIVKEFYDSNNTFNALHNFNLIILLSSKPFLNFSYLN